MIAFKGGRLSERGQRTGLGGRFHPLVRYLVEGPRGDAANTHRLLHFGTRHLPARSPETAAFLLATCAGHTRPDIDEPVYHVGASAAPGEELTSEQWEQVAVWMLEALGLEDHEGAFFVHDDRGHQHLHLVMSRVSPDGQLFHPWMDYPKLRQAMRRAERVYGLQAVAEPMGHHVESSPLQADPVASVAAPANQPGLSDAEFREARRTQEEPLADAIRRQALSDFLAAESWRDLEERLASHGLCLEAAERGGGVVVRSDEQRISISRLDRRLSGPKLAKRFGEPFRHYREREPEPPTIREVVPIQRLEVDRLDDRVETLIHQLETERATFTEQEIRRHVKWQHDQAEVIAAVLDDRRVERVGLDDGGRPLFTTAGYRQAEADLLAAADALHKRSHAALDANVVRTLVAERFAFLADEQRDAILHATSANDLALIAGRAGSGKTALAQAVTEAYRTAGYRVQGAALGGKAAEGLGATIGIDSRTLASLRRSWAKGTDPLDAKSILLIDEAGMLGTRELAELLATVEQAGAKAILVGDPAQIQAIEAGEAFAGLLERLGGARVDTIRRQRIGWMCEASEALADGRVGEAFTAYDAHDAVHWSTDPSTATWDLVASYFRDIEQAPDASRLVFARRNVDVDAINDQIRARRRERGELGREIRLGSRTVAEGDRVVFTKNDHTGRRVRNVDPAHTATGVRNGTLGTLVHATRDTVRVELDDGRLVRFDPRQFQDLRVGYAVTLHKGQGVTVDRSFVLLDPTLDRHATYVAATRHRDYLELWADRQRFADVDAIGRSLSRRGSNDLLSRSTGSIDGPADVLRGAIEREAAVQLDTLPGEPDDYEELADIFDLGDGFVTTNEYAEAELRALTTAQCLGERFSVRLGVDGGTPLAHAVDGADLAVFEGDGDDARALFQQIRDAYAETDRELIATAFTSRAAGELGDALGIESHTLAGLQVRPHRLGRRTVLLVDQAHLVDTRTMDRLLQMVNEAGCRVVLVGDPNGFAPLGAGDGFRLVAEEAGALPLLPDIHDSRILDRLDQLDAQRAVALCEDADTRVVDAYFESPPVDRPMVLTHRRGTAEALNQAIRERRTTELGRAIEVGDRAFAEGDRVLFIASDLQGRTVRTVEGESRAEKGAGVRSGTLGTLEVAQLDELRVRLDDGRLVVFDPREFSAIDHGYVLTTFRANGTRADEVLVLAEPSMDEAAGLVALSSHRRSVQVFARTSDFPHGTKQLGEVLSRRRGKLLVRDLLDERHHAPRPHTAPRTDAIPTLQRHPIHRRRLDPVESRSAPPAPADPVAATRFAIEHLRAFDQAHAELRQIETTRAELPLRGQIQAIADTLLDADSPSRQVLEQAFKRSTQLDAQARRWFTDLDGTRDERVEAVFEASRSLGPDGFEQLPAADRALVRDLWQMTIVPIEQTAEAFEQADRTLNDRHPELTGSRGEHALYASLAAQAALTVAPRPVQRVVGIALTLARLYRDTPRTLLHFITPRSLRQAERAVRHVALLTGSAVEPKAPMSLPSFTRPATQTMAIDPIERLAQALRSGDSSEIERVLPAAVRTERRRLVSQLPGLDRDERRALRRAVSRLGEAIEIREEIRSFDLPRELTPWNRTPEIERQWNRREMLLRVVRNEGLSPNRVVDEITGILQGRSFDVSRFEPRRSSGPASVAVCEALQQLQRSHDHDLPQFLALWKASGKAGTQMPTPPLGLDRRQLLQLAELAPTAVQDTVRRLLGDLRTAQSRQVERDLDDGGQDR